VVFSQVDLLIADVDVLLGEGFLEVPFLFPPLKICQRSNALEEKADFALA
jgi:hypothetical protein